MYARTQKCKGQSWNLLLTRFRSQVMSQHYPCDTSSARAISSLNPHIRRKFTYSPQSWPNWYQFKQYNAGLSHLSHRSYSSKGDGSSASEGKHVPAKEDGVNGDKMRDVKEEIPVARGFANEHARLGEENLQEWLNGERFFIDSKKKESQFLNKRQRFKNEFLRRVIPWENINLSLDSFPYYLNENAKCLLVECVASHLKHKNFTTLYGSCLASSGGRILLHSFPGTELYRERLIKAVARELQVPLLILDSCVLAPFDFGKECLSEVETDEDNEEMSGSEARSSESEEDDPERASAEIAVAVVEALKNLTSNPGLDAFAGRVSGEDESSSASESLETTESESKKSLKKGDRIRYMCKSVPDEADQRSLSSGARGEVYEVTGDQVAVIFDSTENKSEEASKSEDSKEQDEKSSIIWVDIQDLEHDTEAQAEDWYAAVHALCEILPSLEPVIVYFPDSSKWLSKAVPKSNRKEFVQKLEEMLNQISGSVVLVCGQDVVESAPNEKEKYTMVLPQLVRIARLRLTEGLKDTKSWRTDNIWKLFTNVLFLPVPKEEEHLDKKGLLDKAVETLQSMVSKGLQPDVVTYNTVVDGLCKKGDTEKAEELLCYMVSQGLQPDVLTYNTLIDGLCKNGLLDKAVEMHQSMISEGPRPNVVTYNILMDGLCKKGQLEKAVEMLQSLVSEGHDPDVVTYHAVMNALCKEGETEKAEELLNDMLLKGILPNTVTCNLIVDALCKRGGTDRAEKLLYHMLDKGVTPDLMAYTSVINGYSKLGYWKESIRVFKDMIDRGILPNEVTYGSLMDSMCRQGQNKQAQELLDLIERGGIKPGVVSYRFLLLGYANDSTIDDVMNILDRMQLNHVAPDHSTYTSLLNVYAKNIKVDEAMCVLNRMKQEGVKPDLAASAPVLKLLLKMGRDEDAKVVMDQTSGKTND